MPLALSFPPSSAPRRCRVQRGVAPGPGFELLPGVPVRWGCSLCHLVSVAGGEAAVPAPTGRIGTSSPRCTTVAGRWDTAGAATGRLEQGVTPLSCSGVPNLPSLSHVHEGSNQWTPLAWQRAPSQQAALMRGDGRPGVLFGETVVPTTGFLVPPCRPRAARLLGWDGYPKTPPCVQSGPQSSPCYGSHGSSPPPYRSGTAFPTQPFSRWLSDRLLIP